MKNFSTFPTGIIRTPTFSYSLFEQLISGRKSVDDLLADPLFLHAIYLTSPDLYKTCLLYKSGQLTDNKRVTKLKQTLLKYAYRTSTRCTPFGLFSGLGTLTLTDKPTSIIPKPAGFNRTHVRLDMDFVGRVVQKLASLPFLKSYLYYQTNTSVYLLGEQYRYIRYYYKKGTKVFDLTAVRQSAVIDQIIQDATSPRLLNELALGLTDEDVSFDDAMDFLGDVIDQQLLCDELELTSTGTESCTQLLDKLQRILTRIVDSDHYRELNAIREKLVDIARLLNQLDQVDAHQKTVYDAVLTKAQALIADLNEQLLFQCDTILQFEEPPSIDEKIILDLQKALLVKSRLTDLSKRNSTMDQFIEQFKKRYEDKEVPLAEVLDADTGIGYGAASQLDADFADFIDRLPLGGSQKKKSSLTWNDKVHSLLARKITEAIRTGSQVVNLTDGDIDTLPEPDFSQAPHNTFACRFSLYEQPDGEPVIYLKGCGGHTAAALISRFSHADPAIASFTRTITDTEEEINPDCLVAEVNHLPQDRLGNVMQRPVLRQFEIPILANSAVETAYQLPLGDLLVSVRKGRVVLRSRKHDARVLPYITNALNHERKGFPIFRFLGDLQLEENSFLVLIDWGVLRQVFSFIPRIQYKNVIFERAKWYLEHNEISQLIKTGNQDDLSAFTSVADRLNLPDQFVVIDNDNELPICRSSSDSVRLFIDTIKNHTRLVLAEFLPSQYQSPVRSLTGERFQNEMQVFFKNPHKKPHATKIPQLSRVNKLTDSQTKRDFILGTEWVYIKLFCGNKAGDQVVTDVYGLIKPLIDSGLVKKWFFIRYAEDGTHIRLRLQLTESAQIGAVLLHLQDRFAQWKQQGLVWKIVADTYSRELERYGSDTIDLAETIFGHDSVITSRLINRLTDRQRWLAGVCSVDSYLNCFGYDNQQKLKLANDMKERFEAEFNADTRSRKYLNDVFNTSKDDIRTVLGELNKNGANGSALSLIRQAIAAREQAVQPLADALIDACRPDSRLEKMATDLIHMSVNRLFRSRQRLFEYAIYHFLKVHYTTLLHATSPKGRSDGQPELAYVAEAA